MALRDYQLNAVEASANFFKYRNGLHGYVTAPGGSGKSHMIAALAERIHDLNVGRVIVLARSEKLLTQNHSKFDAAYRDKIGMYCAGLNSWDFGKPITIASIQSIAGEIPDDKIAAIIVDECDEINTADEETQYAQFFTACGNPPILGFTATPFRTGSGSIEWGEEIINIPLAPIMAAGYLTPPTNKVGTILDLSHVPVRLGEYATKEIEEIYADPELLELSIRKIKQYSAERNAVLIYCQSLRHADIVANAMEFNGMPCVVVSGDTDKEELYFILEDLEAGRVKYIINVMLLVRGFDMPAVDMIALLLATKSKRKFEQILYRGTRLKEGKKDFLVLDMGNNFDTHGPLGSPYGGSAKGESKYKGKICPECEEYVTPLTAKECGDCGYQFPEAERAKVNHAYGEDTTSETVYRETVINSYEVSDVLYKRHKGKNGKPDTLRVDYYCGFGKYGNVSEWLSVMPEANEFGRKKAQTFFKDRGNAIGDPAEYSFEDLLWHAEQLKKPVRITVDHSGEFPRITRYEWPDPSNQLSLEEMLGEDSL